MKKAIAVIPFVARRRRRNAAQRGAKIGGPALLGGAAAVVALVVRRRKRSAAGFDASQSELSDNRPAPKTAPPTAGDATPQRAETAAAEEESDSSGSSGSSASAEDQAPANGDGRPSTLDGDPAETVPHAGITGVGENHVIPDTGTDDPLVREAEAAAASDAGSIGGDVPGTPPSGESDFATDPVTRPSEEHAGNSYESFSERES